MSTGWGARDPVEYHDGEFRVSPMFETDPLARRVMAMLGKSLFMDYCAWLYLVKSGSGIYSRLPTGEREQNAVRAGHIKDWKRLGPIIGESSVRELTEFYSSLVMLPAERLRLGMSDAVNRLLDELSAVEGDSDEYMAVVERAKVLHGYAKDIEEMANEGGKKKTRAGYVPKGFERRTDVEDIMRRADTRKQEGNGQTEAERNEDGRNNDGAQAGTVRPGARPTGEGGPA